MALPVLAGPVFLDDASVVATAAYRTEQTGFPADNLIDARASEVWRSDKGDCRAMVDLGAAREADLVALIGTNATATGTWRVRAGSSEANAAAGATYDSGLLSLWPVSGLEERLRVNALHLLATPQTARFWYVTAADAGNAASYLEAQFLLVAKAWRPPRQLTVEDGFRFGYLDPAETARAYGGASYAETRARPRFAEFAFAFMAASDRAQGEAFARRYGAARPMLFWRDPEDAQDKHEHALWGRLVGGEQAIFHRHQAYWSQRFRIEETL